MDDSLRHRIVEATQRVMFRQGISAIRVDNIARDCGISKRTLYEQFGDKDSLISAALEVHRERMDRQLREIPAVAENSLDALLRGVSVVRESLDKVSETFILEMRASRYAPNFGKGRELEKQFVQNLAELIRQGQQDGYFLSEHNPELVARICVNQSSSLKTNGDWLTSYSEALEYIDTAQDCFVRGIVTPLGLEYYEKFKREKNNKKKI